ncbi:MAG: methyltransferase domain-containing protein [Thermoanaerobaculia bacterium]
MVNPGTHPWGTQPEMFGPRHEHRLAMILRETAKLPSGARVLDAAVGLGQLASRLREQGHRVFGIDGAFAAALHATRVARVPSVVADMTKLPFRSGAFDGITSGETLEHLDDDAGAVRELERVLGDGGRCVVTVPALQALWTRSDEYYEHRRRYSRAGLSELFQKARLRVEKATFWGFPVVLVYDTVFLLPMNMRRARRKPDADPALQSVARAGRSRALVSVVRAAFAIDRLFSFVPFGPGLLLVARKRLERGSEAASGE